MNIDPGQIPKDVLAAAITLERYFKNRGVLEWSLRGVQSLRNFKPCGWVVVGHTQEFGWVTLVDYASTSEGHVAAKVMAAARREGFEGTFAQRMRELHWETRPLYVGGI